MFSEDEARALARKILSYSRLPQCEVQIDASEDSFVRFANNAITTSGLVRQQRIQISSTKDRKTGNTSLNQADEKSLRDAVSRSEAMAEIAPPNEEAMPSLPPQRYLDLDRCDSRTASVGAPELTGHAGNAIDVARAKGLVAAGFVRRSTSVTAIAAKTGLFGYQPAADSSLSVTVRTPSGDASGWAAQPARVFPAIDSTELARRAVEKCQASRNGRRLEPGKYAVVMEPAAVAAVMPFFTFELSARSAEEGRSFLAKTGGGTMVGEKIFPEHITLRSDPAATELPARPWDDNWVPAGPVSWIERGVVKNLYYDRFWAMRKGVAPSPLPSALVLDGSKDTVNDLIAATERGLLITHFWYIRFLNPKTVQLTGLTRDGLFLIERGKIAGPVMNMRFNDSPVRLLQNTIRLSTPVRSVDTEVEGDSLFPALQASEFTFSSVSDAV